MDEKTSRIIEYLTIRMEGMKRKRERNVINNINQSIF